MMHPEEIKGEIALVILCCVEPAGATRVSRYTNSLGCPLTKFSAGVMDAMGPTMGWLLDCHGRPSWIDIYQE
jgi:hypothetical protein